MSAYETQRLVKRQIKANVKALLLERTLAEKRVSISRSAPTQYEECPALLIYTMNEDVSRFNEAPKSYRRVLRLVVECIAAGADDDEVDLILEELGEQVESLMEIDETLGGLVNKLELTGAEYQSESAAATPLGSLILTFDLEHFNYPKSGEPLRNLLLANVKWRVGEQNADVSDDTVDDAEDEIELSGGENE